LKLKLVSLLFIVALSANLLIAYQGGAGGTWGLSLPLFVLLILLGVYGVFWVGGNLYLLAAYRKPDKALVAVLLNLPAVVVAAGRGADLDRVSSPDGRLHPPGPGRAGPASAWGHRSFCRQR